MNAARYHIGKPTHPWQHYPKWAAKDSEKMIQNLHHIEAQLRKEIRLEQVKFWTKEEIDRVYNT